MRAISPEFFSPKFFLNHHGVQCSRTAPQAWNDLPHFILCLPPLVAPRGAAKELALAQDANKAASAE